TVAWRRQRFVTRFTFPPPHADLFWRPASSGCATFRRSADRRTRGATMANNNARRMAAVRSWIAVAACVLLSSLACADGGGRGDGNSGPGGTPAVSIAQANEKLSPDLREALASAVLPPTNWVKETSGGRLLKLLIVSYDTTDPSLASLRHAILDARGSVYYKFASVNGLLAMLPASAVVDIARRADVETISPNRPTLRMASLAESASGAAAARSAAGTGLDGSGVGIAFLDSGIMAAHQAFADASGASRVKKSVDMRLLSDSIAARWQSGVDSSTSMGPGSAGRQRLESTIDARGSTFQDPYGHG